MDTSDTGTSTSSRSRGRRGAATPAASEAPSLVVLGPRDSLVGTLTVEGDVRIEGTVDGDISATGEISVAVGGSVEGNASATELVALGESASFAGEIRAGRLRVDEGATLNATISMT